VTPDALITATTAAKWLAGAAAPAIAVWRLLSHDRALLYSILPKLGRKVDARKLQETLVLETQKAYANESKVLSRQSELLTKKFLSTIPAKRPLVQRDLEYIQTRKREIDIKYSALCDLASTPARGKGTNINQSISGHWMDQFNELVRRRNEEWRALLLKDALVQEAEEPGRISPRVLWLIGLLEPEKFECLAALLDIAAKINEIPAVPGETLRLKRGIVPGLEEKRFTINHASTSLMDTGILQDSNVAMMFDQGDKITAAYHNERLQLTAVGLNARVSGIHFTSLGQTIAGLYKPSPNAFGEKLFTEWIKELSRNEFAVGPAR
jgi:hypothetical protein